MSLWGEELKVGDDPWRIIWSKFRKTADGSGMCGSADWFAVMLVSISLATFTDRLTEPWYCGLIARVPILQKLCKGGVR